MAVVFFPVRKKNFDMALVGNSIIKDMWLKTKTFQSLYLHSPLLISHFCDIIQDSKTDLPDSVTMPQKGAMFFVVYSVNERTYEYL